MASSIMDTKTNSFSSSFLGYKNQDLLVHILSYLRCNDLGQAANTCTVLNQTVNCEDNGNADIIFRAAALTLTKSSERQKKEQVQQKHHMFRNAREKCNLVAIASTYAEECETTDEVPENRMNVDGVIAHFMNATGYDPESVRKLVEEGKEDTRALEQIAREGAAGMTWTDEIVSAQHDLVNKKPQEKIENPPKKKEYHHKIFVRVTRLDGNEVIAQGFCNYYDLPCGTSDLSSQQLLISLAEIGIEDAPEWASLVNSFDGTKFAQGDMLQAKLRFTVIAVGTDSPFNSSSAQCIFQSDDGRCGLRPIDGPPLSALYQQPLKPKQAPEIVQFGRSYNRFCLNVGVGIYIVHATRNIIPGLVLNIEKDEKMVHAVLQSFMLQNMQQNLPEGAVINTIPGRY